MRDNASATTLFLPTMCLTSRSMSWYAAKSHMFRIHRAKNLSLVLPETTTWTILILSQKIVIAECSQNWPQTLSVMIKLSISKWVIVSSKPGISKNGHRPYYAILPPCLWDMHLNTTLGSYRWGQVTPLKWGKNRRNQSKSWWKSWVRVILGPLQALNRAKIRLTKVLIKYKCDHYEDDILLLNSLYMRL